MRVDKLKTNLGDTIKIIFKTKMEYEKWLQYVKDVCITCEKVDPIFQVIPKDLKENATENLDTGGIYNFVITGSHCQNCPWFYGIMCSTKKEPILIPIFLW